MASIFEPIIQTQCQEKNRPALPVTVEDIGVFWKRFDSKWFVGGVYAGSPAQANGLTLGDEVVSADGLPFSPVAAFAGKANRRVSIGVRRSSQSALMYFDVVPRSLRPQQSLIEATRDSWKIFDRGQHRYAYIHIWSWTSPVVQQALSQAIMRSNEQAVDGFVIDIRDGWGGASASYLSIFDTDIPVLVSRDRGGKASAYDAQIRKPTVILINGGSRSGKEVIAYGAKKHRLARLVGEPTAGAVTFGEPFCLNDGSLLYLAVEDAFVDGEKLEGVGVKPDVLVPFDIRYANGHDPQLEKALSLLASS